ncbi:MAG: hypothetical protein M1822_004552 [Bathelium mastoideum]|nr:MAG: hypothetical protein M1822_004552 [Bathelium mastoideum]
MSPEDEIQEEANYEVFRDFVSSAVLQRLAAPKRPERRRAAKGRKTAIKPVERPSDEVEIDDAEDLSDFIDYIATEIFTSLPLTLRTLSYSPSDPESSSSLLDHYTAPTTLDALTATLPPTITDSLTTYSLIPRPSSTSPSADPTLFLHPLLLTYLTHLLTPPPPPSAPARPSACELCERDQLPLTIHHLIPRSHTAKAVRRGWCTADEPATRLAYLCRACHSFVHGLAGNEELARSGWARSVEGIREERAEEVGRWVGWVGRVRWRKR